MDPIDRRRFLLLAATGCASPALFGVNEARALSFGRSAAPAREATDRERSAKLSGAFIQLTQDMMALTAADWRDVVSAMRDAGMDVIILQRLQYGHVRLFPSVGPAVDPVAEILAQAAQGSRPMRVFVGLLYDPCWYDKWEDAGFLDNLLHGSRTLADEVATRYGRSPAFAGWYIPQEMWNHGYKPGHIAALASYFGRLSRHCKGLLQKPVAVSPYFNPTLSFIDPDTPAQNARKFADNYRQFLGGAGLDIVMVQDGVGARCLDSLAQADLDALVQPYFYELTTACLEKGVDCWANLENYKTVRGGCRDNQAFAGYPTDFARFRRQLTAAEPFFSTFVTFDFFHYMNPHGHLQSDATYVRDQRALYDEYRRAYP